MQTTLKSAITLSGIGLHSGAPANLTVRPAPVETGIWFRRTDVVGFDTMIPAAYDMVNDTQLCTRIANEDGVEVSTIEHLMAALAGCGIHNAIVEIDGPEVPIMDGSSQAFVRAILNVGVQEQSEPVRAIRVLKTVELAFDDVVVALHPADTLEIDFSIDFQDTAIGHQAKDLRMANGAFVRELSDCRTFVRRADVDALKNIGLAQGGSLDNAVVVDGATVLNPEGFRHADECVRHKMLDALGDLALAGAPILGRYEGSRAGHKATNLLLRKLFATPDTYEMVVCDATQDANLPGSSIRLSDLRAA